MHIKFDGKRAEVRENNSYKGYGMISCNGSSRLLMDYKVKSPNSYWEILKLLYGKGGLEFSHFKVEMGADVNTSSGTEPMVKRTEAEKADVTRGAGFQLAADIKTINPDVTLDMLWWSEPRWVSDAEDVYAKRYQWYKETLDAAYDTYGLKFDYVSGNRNEREVEGDWIVYLSEALKQERDCPYDYSKIKIVAADECGGWNIAKQMLENEELCNAVDVIGSHYTSFASEEAKKLADEKGKELWFSEGSSPMVYAPSAVRFDEGKSGLIGLNGVFDIANRMITMVSKGYMTMYEYQPAVAAYYDGVTYCQKQLINASTPWNGYYSVDSGYFMNLHFSRFIKKGWHFIYDACYADGVPGGDGHCIVDAKYSYMTACGENGDYSTVIVNTTSGAIEYEFEVTNLEKAEQTVFVWETRGPEEGQRYDANYFRKTTRIQPINGVYKVSVKPYSMVTVSTVDVQNDVEGLGAYQEPCILQTEKEKINTVFPLPYCDDFQYADDFLATRGGAPLYTTDEGGAFEVVPYGDKNVLEQRITRDIKANEWGGTPEPTTNFGDDRWYNYCVSARVHTDGIESYVGVGARYILADDGMSGYALLLYGDGRWALYAGKEEILNGLIDNFVAEKWYELKLAVTNNQVMAVIDGEKVAEYKAEQNGFGAGRAALYSSYHHCRFEYIKVEATDSEHSYVEKSDNLDEAVTYSEAGWEHTLMSSFRNYRRTISTGTEGASALIRFCGSGIVLTGEQKTEGVVCVELDGSVIEEAHSILQGGARRAFYSLYDQEPTEHCLKITVLSGSVAMDSVQIIV